jgi:SAM-dependent methyltransferase
MPRKDLHEANRISWDAATRVHNSHKGDQAKFFREGGNTLFLEDMQLLGDLTGKTLLHLQCNAGQDTLSIAKHLGAQVTGVDISDEAVNFARQLAQDSGIPATFVRSDIYDWFEQNSTQYDVVYMSYGTLPWLSDIQALGRGVAAALKAGGHYVLIEFHPLLAALDDNDSSKLAYDYMGGRHYAFEYGVGDYVGGSGDALIPSTTDKAEADRADRADTNEKVDAQSLWNNPNPSHEFAWGLGETASAFLQAGLVITHLQEYDYTNGYRPFVGAGQMQALPGRRFTLPHDRPKVALMFSLVAQKPTDHIP